MKLIIAGSREMYVDWNFLDGMIGRFGIKPFDYRDIKVVSGGAKGIDVCGEGFAKSYGLECHQFLPDYDMYAGRAPLVRNSKMAAFADALLLIWDGKSNGSKDMKTKMLELKKPVYEVIIRSYNEPLHDN